MGRDRLVVHFIQWDCSLLPRVLIPHPPHPPPPLLNQGLLIQIHTSFLMILTLPLLSFPLLVLHLLRPSPAPHLKRFNSLLIILTQRPSLRSVRIRPHSITNSSPVLFSIDNQDIFQKFKLSH
uniref:Uncharacterized protein n=1 Tax=Cacopsylla melanoneura TaxID=428564 RepID=A0A8D8M895_9HEMI